MNINGIGIIGCGIWGTIHAQVFSSSPFTKLITVCDQDSERAEQLSQKYGAENYTTNYQEILNNPDISTVSIATPDHTHTQLVLDALKAGKHVLVEKPLATTVDECKQILAARDATGVILMVDFHNHWNIPFIQVKKMVDFNIRNSSLRHRRSYKQKDRHPS